MVAEHLAVIGREDDDGAVGLTGVVEPVEDPAELIVDLGHHPVVGGLQLTLLLRVVG